MSDCVELVNYRSLGSFWVRIKILLRIFEQLKTVLDTNECDEIDKLSWSKLETSSESLLFFLSNEFPQFLPKTLEESKSSHNAIDIKIDFIQLDSLINSLVDISLLREYHIINDYNVFIKNFIDTLKYFEKTLYNAFSQ